MMLINKRDEIFFIDRNNSVFEVENLTFLKYNNLNEHLEDTLLDGVYNGLHFFPFQVLIFVIFYFTGNGFG